MMLSKIILGVLLLVAAVGPPLFLRWTWRRWQSGPRMVVHVLLLGPLLYFAGAGLALLHIVLHWLFLLKPVRWDSYIDGLSLIFGGIYTVFLAAMFACVWVPAVLVWRKWYPASFARMLRR